MIAVVPTEREATAAHEAGHAVMRWLRGLPATPISVIDDRLGKCGGTGQLYPAEDVLLVTLAGYAAESAFGTADVDFSAPCHDFDYARRILVSAVWLRRRAETLDEAIERYFGDACELLRPHTDLIHRLRDMLLRHKWVSAEGVAASCEASRQSGSCGPPYVAVADVVVGGVRQATARKKSGRC